MVKNKGVEIELGDKTYILPPLNCAALEQFGDKLETFNELPVVKKIGFTVDLTLASLHRNYPELKREEIAEVIDLGNMAEVIQVVMGVSGLVRSSGEVRGNANKKS